MKQKLIPKLIKKYDALLLFNHDINVDSTVIVLTYIKHRKVVNTKIAPFDKILTNDEALEKMFEIVKSHKENIYLKIKDYVIGDEKGYWYL